MEALQCGHLGQGVTELSQVNQRIVGAVLLDCLLLHLNDGAKTHKAGFIRPATKGNVDYHIHRGVPATGVYGNKLVPQTHDLGFVLMLDNKLE